MYSARSEERSNTESKKPPKRVHWLLARATRPSTISKMAAPVTTTPAQRKLPAAKSHAAQILISRPRNVSTLGGILDSASQRTIRSIIAPKNQPIARVAVISLDYFVDGGELADLQFFGSAGAHNLDLVTHFLVEQGAPDGRRGGDPAIGGIGLFAGHQVISELFVAFDVEHNHGGTEAHLVMPNLVHIDHRHVRQALLQVADACIEEALPVLARVIFRVLAQVPMGPCLEDFLWQLDQVFVFEHSDLILEFLLNVGHRRGTAPKVTL